MKNTITLTPAVNKPYITTSTGYTSYDSHGSMTTSVYGNSTVPTTLFDVASLVRMVIQSRPATANTLTPSRFLKLKTLQNEYKSFFTSKARKAKIVIEIAYILGLQSIPVKATAKSLINEYSHRDSYPSHTTIRDILKMHPDVFNTTLEELVSYVDNVYVRMSEQWGLNRLVINNGKMSIEWPSKNTKIEPTEDTTYLKTMLNETKDTNKTTTAEGESTVV